MKDTYIKLLAKSSETRNHELVLDCMNHYGVNCTRELTERQLVEFCKMKGLVNEDVR